MHLVGLRKKRTKITLKLDWSMNETEPAHVKVVMKLLLVISSWVFDKLTTETSCGYKQIANIIGFCTQELSVVRHGFPQDMYPVKEYQGEQGEPVVLSVARISRYKGHHVLIEAFSEVVKKFPNWKLSIVDPITDELYKQELDYKIASLGLTDQVTIHG